MNKREKNHPHPLDSLTQENCTRCKSCTIFCPTEKLTIKKGVPKSDRKCKNCELCRKLCHRLNDNKKNPNEKIGKFLNAYSTKSKIEKIREKAQDGGTITTIIHDLLQENYIDGAIVTKKKNKTWKPEPTLVEEPEKAVEYSGTIYSIKSPIPYIKKIVEIRKKKKLAVIGTPCQVQALREMEKTHSTSKITKSIKLIIGLFCMECYPPEKISNFIENELKIKIENVKKFDISKGKFIVKTEKQEKQIPIKKLKNMMYPFCKNCIDYTAENADLSIGNVGAPKNHNSTIVRTERGKKALQKVKNLKIEKLETKNQGISLIKKLSNEKKEKRK